MTQFYGTLTPEKTEREGKKHAAGEKRSRRMHGTSGK